MPEEISSISNTELRHAMFIALIEELEISKQLESYEARLLKQEYTRLYEETYALQLNEINLVRKCNMISSDILTEQINLEKEKLRETEEEKELSKLNDICENVQIELEFTEQKDTMAKFELAELRKIHNELMANLEKNQLENANTVDPILTDLKKEVM
jgi:hypothetical protein